MSRHGTSHAVATVSARMPSKTVYLVVFLVASVAVFAWDRTKVRDSDTADSYPATATVHRGIAAEPSGSNATRPSPGELKRIEDEALFNADPAIRRELHVTARTDPSGGQIDIAFLYADSDPARAAAVVNELAQSYADAFRAQWRTAAQRTCSMAHETAERAQQEYLKAKTQLDDFWKRTSEAGPSDPAGEQAAPPAGQLAAPMVENPDWVALEQQLAQLRRRQEQMLVDRTPLHPEVQHGAIRIAELARQLETVPRQIPGKPTEAVATRGEPVRRQAPAITAQTQQTLRALQAGVDRAYAGLEAANRAERAAWQAGLQEPPLRLELARPAAIAPVVEHTGDPLRAWLPLMSVLAGIGTVGVLWMAMQWVTYDPVMNTVAQVRATVRAPIVGAIPGDY